MYPLDRGMWGPTVRISHLRDELGELVDLDVVSGYRGARRLALARYALSGRLRRLDGIYVESSSFLPAETDLAFLGLARALGIPVLTYVRDAYQLFDDYYAADSLRRRLGAKAFLPMMRALGAVSSRLAFPSRGLAQAVLGTDGADAVLLPPGSPPPVEVAREPDANQFLFVGDARLPAQGGDRLVAAVARARERGIMVGLTIVSRGDGPGARPEWLRVVRAEGAGITALLPAVIATVIPRPRGPYNDLAVPVKLYDYLSYARPLIVTDCLEQARVVEGAGAGVIVGDEPHELAEGIVRVMTASGPQLEAWSERAVAAARAASWAHRARQVVEAIVPG